MIGDLIFDEHDHNLLVGFPLLNHVLFINLFFNFLSLIMIYWNNNSKTLSAVAEASANYTIPWKTYILCRKNNTNSVSGNF
jgi:hypothetical protein